MRIVVQTNYLLLGQNIKYLVNDGFHCDFVWFDLPKQLIPKRVGSSELNMITSSDLLG